MSDHRFSPFDFRFTIRPVKSVTNQSHDFVNFFLLKRPTEDMSGPDDVMDKTSASSTFKIQSDFKDWIQKLSRTTAKNGLGMVCIGYYWEK